MTLTRTFAAGTLMLAACGGEASLGSDRETWAGPPEEVPAGARGIHFATAILTGEVKSCPLSGACGSGEVLAVAQRWPSVVKVSSSRVLWLSAVPDDSAFVKLAPGGTPSKLAPQTGTLGPVVVDGGYVYWAAALRDSNIDRIQRV